MSVTPEQLEDTAFETESDAETAPQPSEQSERSARSERSELTAEELVTEDLLVEDVSIDGMCGVY